MKSILATGFCCALLAGQPAGTFAADSPDAPPTTAPDTTLETHGWELTPYLKGSSAEIRDKLNGEVERLAIKVRETETAIKQGNTDCDNDEKDALTKVHKSAAYQQAASEKTKAEADLETARKSGSAQDRLEASSRFNKARGALEAFDHDAVTKNEDLTRDRHAVSEAQKNLKRYNEALDKAFAWRSELLDDTRNGFMMKAPLVDGTKGTLPRVTVQKVIDAGHVIVEFEALTIDVGHPGKDIEGIKVFSATKAKVLILVSGVDAKGLKKDDKVNFDRNFVLDGVESGERGDKIYKAKPSPDDADILFERIVPIREPLPPRFAPAPKNQKPSP